MFDLYKQQQQLDLEGTPISVALIGTGTMGKAYAESITQSPGMILDAICDIRIEQALGAYKNAGVSEASIAVCDTKEDAEKALKSGKKVATTKLEIACALDKIDVVTESTGVPDVYARIGLNALMNNKHYVTMCIEGDVAIGHIMNRWFKAAGKVYTGIYGDEPGSCMLQISEARSLGLEVVAAGRTEMGSGSLDENRENITNKMKEMGIEYENKSIYTSFCDGSKTNEESTTIANAAGLCVDVRGTHHTVVPYERFVNDVPAILCPKEKGGILNNTPAIEIIASPEQRITYEHGTRGDEFIWVYCVAHAKTPLQQMMLTGSRGITSGEYTVFYGPWHAGSLQAPITIATAAIDGRAVVAPLEGFTRAADTITQSKRNLRIGQKIDEIGGMDTAGRIERASITRKERLLPFSLAEGCKIIRDVPKAGYLTLDDVEIPQSLIWHIRQIQDKFFGDMY